MKDSTILGIVAIGAGTVVTTLCIVFSVDTAIIASFVGVLGTIVGYAYGVHKKEMKE